jgi:hypothetical protein
MTLKAITNRLEKLTRKPYLGHCAKVAGFDVETGFQPASLTLTLVPLHHGRWASASLERHGQTNGANGH